MPADQREVLLVGSDDDSLLSSVAHAARVTRANCIRVTCAEFAAGVTITDSDVLFAGEPLGPLLLRAIEGDSKKDEFLQQEEWSVLWAASALSRQTVVNRATALSLWGWAGQPIAVIAQAARHRDPSLDLACYEVHVSRAEILDGADLVGRNLMTGTTFRRGEGVEVGRGPVRARRTDIAPDGLYQYQTASVVGDEVWLRPHGLAADRGTKYLSLQLAQALELDLAILTWELAEMGRRLVTVDTYPTSAAFGQYIEFASREIIKLLTQ